MVMISPSIHYEMLMVYQVLCCILSICGLTSFLQSWERKRKGFITMMWCPHRYTSAKKKLGLDVEATGGRQTRPGVA